MKTKLLFALILIVIFSCTLVGCNKNEEITETVPIPTFAPHTTPAGQVYSHNQSHKDEEKTEYGQTEFLYGRLSSVENIKNGKPQTGDTVIIDGYRYMYNVVLENRTTMLTSDMNGWSVVSETHDRKTTEGIKEKIFGIPVKSLNYCFYASSNLTEIKDLPNSVESCVGTFEGCLNVKEVKNLPSSLTNANRMFAYCESLATVSGLPHKLNYADEMFYYCLALQGEITIPNTLESYNNMFKNTRKEIVLLGNKELNEKIKNETINIKLK